MDLTESNKKHIDSLSYEELLRHWRFAPVGDPWFQGETGRYWAEQMNAKKATVKNAAAVSKRVGWYN